ncbi:MAG: TlpA family protein disulfide reductase [Bdellovibrionaceae bacterium]|nr:TlpA family protein disulfide reductase [Bdellovibrionales bacterium]MCB9083867.1 TlpA family protein disulfide reductase [Pseudobdellovibrionaceae bacterium]
MRQFLAMCLLLVVAPLTASALEVGEAAPSVVLTQISATGMEAPNDIIAREAGTTTDYKVLEFFSTTCPACHESLPIFSALATEFAGKVTFRQVGLDRDPQKVRDYITEKKALIHYDVALDNSREAARAYKIRYTPTLFVVDGNSQIVVKIIGVPSPEQLDELRQLFNGN